MRRKLSAKSLRMIIGCSLPQCWQKNPLQKITLLSIERMTCKPSRSFSGLFLLHLTKEIPKNYQSSGVTASKRFPHKMKQMSISRQRTSKNHQCTSPKNTNLIKVLWKKVTIMCKLSSISKPKSQITNQKVMKNRTVVIKRKHHRSKSLCKLHISPKKIVSKPSNLTWVTITLSP